MAGPRAKNPKVVISEEIVTELIQKIELQESLWKSLKNNPHVQGPAWKQIGLELRLDVKVLKTKWQTLKKQMTSVLLMDIDDEGRQEIFEHYNEMSFIKSILLEKAAQPQTKPASVETDEIYEALDALPALPSSSTSNVDASTEVNSSMNMWMTLTDEEYLTSLLPITGQLDDLEKLLLRIQMLELLAFCTYDLPA